MLLLLIWCLGICCPVLDDAPWCSKWKEKRHLQQPPADPWIGLGSSFKERAGGQDQGQNHPCLACILYVLTDRALKACACSSGRYKDRSGKERFCGTAALKGTAKHACNMVLSYMRSRVWPVYVRSYPPGFPRRILNLYEKQGHMPRRDLRRKAVMHPERTDRELFSAMPDHDSWTDARLHEVVLYLAENEDIEVPACWQNCMDEYVHKLRQQDACCRLTYCSVAGLLEHVICTACRNFWPILRCALMQTWWLRWPIWRPQCPAAHPAARMVRSPPPELQSFWLDPPRLKELPL